MWSALLPIGRDGGTGGYRRFAWTREDHTLREWFAGECATRGLDLVEDRMGNQWAWWGDPDAQGAGVVTGSHLDSVPDGGAYDGPLGVISALAAVDRLRAQGFRPDRPIGLVNFVDEEGARFGVACAGSRVITGALPADRALGLRDSDGVTMAEAMIAAGRRPAHLGFDAETLGRVRVFVELHVEQGRGLVDQDQPVGIGTGIWPHGRWRIDFPGEANHAGTTRLADRHDAMLGYASTVLAARDAASRHGCLATMGKVRVSPGGVNAIAGRCRAGWTPAARTRPRSGRPSPTSRRPRPRPGPRWSRNPGRPPPLFSPTTAGRLQQVLPDAPLLSTGAGHDAGILAAERIPAAMLFVRNPTGVSHSPAEWASEADCLAGVEALAAVLADLSSVPR